MSKIERRRAVVTLYQGNYEQEIEDIADAAIAAEQADAGQKRHGTKSKANELAKQHDALIAEAEQTAVKVTVWAISYTQWGPLADEHPPRKDEERDKLPGVNMSTFPRQLLEVSLVAPGASSGIADLKAKGAEALADLGDISRTQYMKLEHTAWNVNVGDDSLPKFSLVSLLQQQRDQGSKQPNDTE